MINFKPLLQAWKPQANKERSAPLAMEVLRMADETLEAFFLLPIPRHPILLPDLMSSLDKCLYNYISTTRSHCGKYYIFTTKFHVNI